MRSQQKKTHRIKGSRGSEAMASSTEANRTHLNAVVMASDEIQYNEQDLIQVRHVSRDAFVVVVVLVLVAAFFGAIIYFDGRSDLFEKLSDSAARAAGLIK
jgi:hypothetical protein